MTFAKWLRILAYITILSLVNSVFDYLPFVPAAITTWVTKGIMAATVYCMFKLSGRNNRYRTSAIFRAVTLGCALVTSFAFGSHLLNIAISVFSVLAVYQEYAAHAETVAGKDMCLSHKWCSLFYWELAAATFLSWGSAVTAILLVSSQLQTDASMVSGIVFFLLKMPQFALRVVRLLYLYKMIAFCHN